jgi:D-sedoheptulose 7-phosphate isomerase
MSEGYRALRNSIEEAISIKKTLLNNEEFFLRLDEAISTITKAFSNGNKLLIAGNGGSAADAQHFATELVGTFRKEKRRGLPAIALTTDTSFLTAWSNDFEFETAFSRQVEALGKQGDVFFGISTSGNSRNVILAVEKAKELNMKTICLLGDDGGMLKDLADISIIIPSNITARIQEAHIMVIHIICEALIQNV